MTTKCIVTLTLLAALFVPPVAADDVDVSGDWVITMETPRGPRDQGVKFVQDGTSLTVIPLDNTDTISEGSGTIEGNEITWSWTVASPRGATTVTFTGTVSGNTMSGTRDRNRGEAKWTAVKK